MDDIVQKLPDGSGLVKEYLGSKIIITAKGIPEEVKKSLDNKLDISNRQWILAPVKYYMQNELGHVEFIGHKKTKTANLDNLQKLLSKYKLEFVTFDEKFQYKDIIIPPHLMEN